MWSHTKRSRSRHTWNTRFDITSWRWWRWRQPPGPDARLLPGGGGGGGNLPDPDALLLPGGGGGGGSLLLLPPFAPFFGKFLPLLSFPTVCGLGCGGIPMAFKYPFLINFYSYLSFLLCLSFHLFFLILISWNFIMGEKC